MDVDAQFHVLAVDDSHVDRKWIERLLKFSSFEVTTVDSGNKALELLGLLDQTNMEDTNAIDFHDYHHDIHVNLIITDYSMPEITGYDLLRKIKESKYLKDIPVIIMSSENIPERINRCLEEGAKEFILKPVQLSDVVDKLKPHLTRREHKECDYYNDASCCSKRKRNDECVSPNKSRININTDHDVLPTFIAL